MTGHTNLVFARKANYLTYVNKYIQTNNYGLRFTFLQVFTGRWNKTDQKTK